MRTTFDQAIAAFAPGLPLAVAYSGGADSTALLIACAARWPGQVRAVHVHHGLQSAADDFVRHCEDVCGALNVPLAVRHVRAGHARGESPEDAARIVRYRAIAELARDEAAPFSVASVALAHHADDQIETLLLALSRGAGLPGLRAMPASWQRDGLMFHRPLLQVHVADIRAWLAARGAAFVVDPSNTDERYTRNRIRARLLPALDAAFPQFRETFARSIGHAAQAQTLLDELAAQDLAVVGKPPAICALQALSAARQGNVLRHWLKAVPGATPSAAQLQEVLRQVDACRTRGHKIHLKVGAGFLVRQGPCLDWYNPEALPPAA
ncbi:MAG: tRNA lysidine(34) synthetase TilS [Rhodoferax sp.]|nr:tRNA lysidine(34) synthetase TilS [Rhodoferax sp.]